MARYKPYQYDQMVLVPLSFQDQPEPGTFEHTLNELVEKHLDLSVFEGRYQNDRTGARAIPPKLLLKVILFAYSRGMISSRQIGRACRENVLFMALSGGCHPDHSTLAHFVSSIVSLATRSKNEVGFMLHLREEDTMTIQSSTQIGNVIRNAVVFNIKNWLGGMMNSDSLIQSVQDFFTLLEQRHIDYVLVGDIAILHYIEGRNTQDSHVLMAASSLEKLPELQLQSQDMYFVQANYNELQIDILLTQNPLFKKVHSQYSKVEKFLDRNIPLATVEGLLLLKLYALPSLYRQGNFARVGIYENDIATLLHDYQPNMSALLNELSQYVNENDLAEIQGVVTDIQKRIKRFENESSE